MRAACFARPLGLRFRGRGRCTELTTEGGREYAECRVKGLEKEKPGPPRRKAVSGLSDSHSRLGPYGVGGTAISNRLEV